ncbi:MAG: VWA domain-containing protein [Acidobacteria bacterium]|nr:VWA domain-containing protein [Acidobacteriota bacterium]
MQRLWLTGHVLPVGARLMVHHVFQSKEKKPMEAVYAFGLPRDAALRRFVIRGEGFTAHSELRPTREAVEEYERGIRDGSLSTLAREHGDGIVNLSVGNIRPREKVTVCLEILAGVELHDDSFRLRFPFTLAPCYHPRARLLEIAPGAGEIELPEDEFGDVMLPQFRQDSSNLHAVGFDLRVTSPGGFDGIGSPSHRVRIQVQDAGGVRVLLAAERDIPNRDLVLDVQHCNARPEALAGTGLDGKRHFIAIVPSTSFGEKPKGARRVVFVLDRSGSMQGLPMEQARKAIEACLGALSAEDSFGLVAFGDQTEHFQTRLSPATRENRDAARAFLASLQARGGTELAPAVEEAAGLGGTGSDLFILTDGQVYGTEQILARARAVGVRLHCLGIGSASQDRFLALLARQTGGVSRFVTATERVDMPAVDLFASLGKPVAESIRVTGAHIQPDPPPCVFAGTPLAISGEGADGELRIQWDGGSLDLPVGDCGRRIGEMVRLLRGARMITDLESRQINTGREQSRIAERLKELSKEYGLASREMSLVAVVARAGDQPGEVPKTSVVPVGMAADTPFAGYFAAARRLDADATACMGVSAALFAHPDAPAARLVSESNEEDLLLELAARIEADGGMPGRKEEDRVLATVLAILAFLQESHSLKTGAFRSHVRRLVEFLEARADRDVVRRVIECARSGRIVPGDWVCTQNATWEEIEEALNEIRS